MNSLDWFVIFIYAAMIIALAIYINRKQKDTEDYYLGGRKIKWWQSGASTMATQLGAISFISAPAFVAIKDGGGLKWLCYEFGVPLALILVMAIIIPTLHQHHYTSIYEYLEKRFDGGVRSLVSLLFQLGRGLATAVTVLAGGLIISTALSISVFWAIILVGLITVIYDALGGIRIVILSDFLQMIIIVVGLLICTSVALSIVGWDAGWASLSPDRFEILDFKQWGFTSGGEYAFWPMLIGGFFLYASYYGCDQSQVQRELSVGGVDDVRKSLMVNALGRFPLVLLYSVMGVFVGAVIAQPEAILPIAQKMGIEQSAVIKILDEDPDRMLPMFILSYLPHGIIGFIFVAIIAALMSSLDSGLNSLSAVTMKDFYQRYIKPNADEKHYLVVSKIITFFWGIFCIVVALTFAGFGEATRQTTIVLINAVGSMLYGPILAAFLIGMFTKRIGPRSLKVGILAGIIVNVILWKFTSISWLWWNLTGFLAMVISTFLTATYFGLSEKNVPQTTIRKYVEDPSKIYWRGIYKYVVLYFFFIILICWLIELLG
ncbi:MAG: hypothetical protein AMJ61_00380 [Desulfobacterales bacterium SG8_35_2]|nr:MAG: hypothetical protein AMJ61_00380 [Desulfobacterales bacterium SG8_35_2]